MELSKLWQSVTGSTSVAVMTALILAFTVVLAVAAVAGPVRAWIRHTLFRTATAFGLVRHRYRSWFLDQHSKLGNTYGGKVEHLDLASVYISLCFDQDADRPERIPATKVLAQTNAGRLIVTGDPGSGKSTLLKAYGSGMLRQSRSHSQDSSDLRLIATSRSVPVYVRLREFAKDCSSGLAAYIATAILERQAQLADGRAYLDRILERGRCVVLLDGLDEVSPEQYRQVKEAILEFAADGSPGAQAQIVLSCRQQNFLNVAEDWIPVFAPITHRLAPLSDAEIMRTLNKRAAEFAEPRSIQDFYKSINEADARELHGTPLILALSLWLYLNNPAYRIPNSIAAFYTMMIRELVSRHSFRTEIKPGPNQFATEVKVRFLRKFALWAAERPGKFDEFTYEEMVGYARTLALRDLSPERAADLVREIIDRSGLIEKISEEDEYIFSHRSFHEFLAADQLSRTPEKSVGKLWTLAGNSQWRQVIVFFASFEHDDAEKFISGLVERNLELVGNCLVVGDPLPRETLQKILDALAHAARTARTNRPYIAALVSATRMSRAEDRDLAVEALGSVLSDILEVDGFEQLGGIDNRTALTLATAITEAESPAIARRIVRLLGFLPDADARTVEILWNYLSIPGVEHEEATSRVVDRLLTLATERDCFAALEELPASRPAALADLEPRRIYPFEHALPPEANLVTLLAWLDYTELEPTAPNRFLTARQENPEAFARVERDKSRRTIFVSLFPIGRSIILAGPIVALIACAYLLVVHWQSFHMFGGWWQTAVAALVPPVAAAVAAGLLAGIGRGPDHELRIGILPMFVSDLGNPSPGARTPGSTWPPSSG